MDAVVAGHYLACDDALIRPVGAELHLLVNCAVGVKVLDKLRNVVVAVLDAVQCALTRALRVLQIPAADLRECVLGVGEDNFLSAGEGAVAVAVGEIRQVDPEKNYRVRVAVVGSEIDDPNLIKLIESCGALVVADRFCYGSFPGRQEIALSEQEDALTQVCRWYLQNTECPRQSALHRVKYRNDHVAQLVREFKADGAIYEQMKFCTYWSYERVIANQIMPRDYGIQVLSIDRPYIVGQSGQLRTRVQAFVESIEMKNLRAARKEEK